MPSNGQHSDPMGQPVTKADLDRLKDELLSEISEELLGRLRIELMAISLGDDYTVSEEEAAMLLDVHPKTLYRYRREERIPCGRFGDKPKYSLGMLRRIMREISNGTLS